MKQFRYILFSCILACFNQVSAQEALLPAPDIRVDSLNDPAPGYIFLATWDRNVPPLYGNFIFLLDKEGAIVDSVRVEGAAYDFQVQSNGLLSYALGDFSSNVPLPGEKLRHVVLDSSLAVVDSFEMKNGYTTDFHEFLMLPNGHVMMMAYHPIPFDMSQVVEGGNTEASLVINVLQEQDREGNMVFEWRNIDYIPITDSDMDLTGSRLNYSTLNAFDLDVDGNILASFRNHSEIMKISRFTGEILWRMGGPRGEFTFINEHEENAPYYYARQHHVRRLPNGHLSLFDNGQFHVPPYSRTAEYEIDEENKMATLVSEWRYPNGNIFCVTAGNAERLPDGGWFIGYGVPNAQFVKRNAVEVHPDGSIALELSLPDGVLAYRATKLPWRETVDRRKFTHYEVREGNVYSFNNETITTGIDIEYQSLEAADYNESHLTRIPYGPVDPEFIEDFLSVSPVSILYEGLAIQSQATVFHFDLSAYPEITDPENTSVYHRKTPGEGLFASITTTYDEGNNKLLVVVDGFGEFVFGVPYQNLISHIPIPYEPLHQAELENDTITLRWTGKGLYNSFHIQVSDDSTFSTVLRETQSNLSSFILTDLDMNKGYFWRVKAELGSHTSSWSEVWKFILKGNTIHAREYKPKNSQAYTLAQNAPNPFHQFTRISYSIEEANNISLIIYDQTGREMQSLVSEYQERGAHTVELDAREFSGGIYFYRLRAGSDYMDTKKMVLIGR